MSKSCWCYLFRVRKNEWLGYSSLQTSDNEGQSFDASSRDRCIAEIYFSLTLAHGVLSAGFKCVDWWISLFLAIVQLISQVSSSGFRTMVCASWRCYWHSWRWGFKYCSQTLMLCGGACVSHVFSTLPGRIPLTCLNICFIYLTQPKLYGGDKGLFVVNTHIHFQECAVFSIHAA
jgi:hypothetical protein